MQIEEAISAGQRVPEGFKPKRASNEITLVIGCSSLPIAAHGRSKQLGEERPQPGPYPRAPGENPQAKTCHSPDIPQPKKETLHFEMLPAALCGGSGILIFNLRHAHELCAAWYPGVLVGGGGGGGGEVTGARS